MEERKRKREQSRQHKMQGFAAASEPRQAPLEARHVKKKDKKSSTHARRQRKEQERARKAGGDAMDIG